MSELRNTRTVFRWMPEFGSRRKLRDSRSGRFVNADNAVTRLDGQTRDVSHWMAGCDDTPGVMELLGQRIARVLR